MRKEEAHAKEEERDRERDSEYRKKNEGMVIWKGLARDSLVFPWTNFVNIIVSLVLRVRIRGLGLLLRRLLRLLLRQRLALLRELLRLLLPGRSAAGSGLLQLGAGHGRLPLVGHVVDGRDLGLGYLGHLGHALRLSQRIAHEGAVAARVGRIRGCGLLVSEAWLQVLRQLAHYGAYADERRLSRCGPAQTKGMA